MGGYTSTSGAFLSWFTVINWLLQPYVFPDPLISGCFGVGVHSLFFQ